LTGDVTLWGDYEMISTVLRNLISNSIKFTKNGGSITISSNYLGNKTEICVKDTGVGMTKPQIHDLFRSDIKTSTRGTSNESGSGIGLKICKDFIERNNGKFMIESEVNKGSTFKFILDTKQPK
jgi:signal transduction histidine kinase